MQTQQIHIIGAGIGGLSLALLLQSKGLQVISGAKTLAKRILG